MTDRGDRARPEADQLDDAPTEDERRTVAVCTTVHGQPDDLRSLLAGLQRQTRPVDVVSVAVAGGGDAGHGRPDDVRLPIRWADARTAGAPMPPAAARNAARAAAGDVDDLIFLDIDIIPSSTFVADYLSRLQRRTAVWMGQLDELPVGPLPRRWSEQALDAAARPHPARRPPQGDRPLPRPEMFWASSFAVPADLFDRIGGFDESYLGSGAEDTDFGLRVAGAGIGLWRTPRARAWRQHHEVLSPPECRLAEVIADSLTFRDRWAHWPQEARLRELVAMGLVDWDPAGGRLELTVSGRRERASTSAAPDAEAAAAS